MYQQPPPPPPAAVPAVPAAKGKRRKGLIILGLILLIGGFFGGGAIVYKGMSNYEDAVKGMARAAVGCDTTLDVRKPATFTIYIETKGKLGNLRGNCEANGSSYEHSGDKLPKVSLTLTMSGGGDELDLQRGTTASYDVAGYVGTGYRTVKIAEAGDYHMIVASDDSDFAVTIGKNPKHDSDQLKTIGGAVALGGVVLGLIFLLLGLRRRRPQLVSTEARYPAGPPTAWTPSPYTPAPTGPPSAPQHPGYRTEPVPGQPPIRLPEQPPGTGFAPPSITLPAAPPPPPPPSNVGWTVPEDEET